MERRRALQEMQHQDQVLYDHFVSRLVARIEEFGADNMRKSVDELRWLRQQAATTCIAESTGLSFQGLNLDVKDLFVRYLYLSTGTLGVSRTPQSRKL